MRTALSAMLGNEAVFGLDARGLLDLGAFVHLLVGYAGNHGDAAPEEPTPE